MSTEPLTNGDRRPRLPPLGRLRPRPREAAERVRRAAPPARAFAARRIAPPLRVPTATGRTVLLGSLAALTAGARLGWLELTAAATVGLVSLLLCLVFVLGHAPVGVEVRPDRWRVPAGQSVAATIELTNRAQRMLLPVDLELSVGPAGRQQPHRIPTARLGRDETRTLERFLTIPTERRGVIVLGPATTVRADPLGLLRRTVQWPQRKELIVHPRTVRLDPLGSGLLHDLEGRTDEQISASDLDFHALRDYVRGDDRRHIHWRSSARAASLAPGAQRFLVRQFLQTHSTHLLIAVDGDPASYQDPDQFEAAVSAAASVGARAVEDRIGATLVVADRDVRELTDEAALFDASARAEYGAGGEFGALVARGARLAPHSSVALLVTGPLADGARLRRVRARLRAEVAVSALRIDPAKPTGVVQDAAMTVYTLARLSDLRSLLGAGATSGGIR